MNAAIVSKLWNSKGHVSIKLHKFILSNLLEKVIQHIIIKLCNNDKFKVGYQINFI